MEERESAIQTTFSTVAGIANLTPNMRQYLSFRACGFTIRESCALAHVHEVTARRWRSENPEFGHLDTEGIGELVDKFSHRYLEIEFLRNYRLILKKDFEVIIKSIAQPTGLSSAENQYLLKARGHYTPEQLNIIKGLVQVGGLTEFDFTQFVLQFQQEPQLVQAAKARLVAKGG